jgi:putative colanic acid biosynthesis acetyltransferase WcaF
MPLAEDNLRRSPFPLRQQLARLGWQLFCSLFIRLSPRPLHRWRALCLRMWGARIGPGCRIYPGAIIWAPWNLHCADAACVADGAELYNPAPIHLGARAVVSQGAFICTASHDYRKDSFPLVAKAIAIGADAWVGARAIVLPGCDVGEGSVIGAGSVVTRATPAWSVCAGNPCRVVRERYTRS